MVCQLSPELARGCVRLCEDAGPLRMLWESYTCQKVQGRPGSSLSDLLSNVVKYVPHAFPHIFFIFQH